MYKMKEVKAFKGLGHRCDERYSDAQTYVFVRQKEEKRPEFG